MVSFLPKLKPREIYPVCVDLDELFSDPKFAGTVDRVIRYLHRLYADFSDGSFERITRPGVVTEQFFLCMPTVEAFIAEIELCNAMRAHALGNVSDEKIKVYLQKYLDTHIFVYREIAGILRQEFKVGAGKRTGRDVPLFSLDNGLFGSGGVFNAIQAHLFRRLEAFGGNNAGYTITKL